MEEECEMYQTFQEFLREFLFRRAKGELNAHDFDEEKFEYLRPHLQGILPTLSLTDCNRLQVYFTDLLIYHLTGEMYALSSPILDINENDAQSPLSESPRIAEVPQNSTALLEDGQRTHIESQVGTAAITVENNTESSLPKKLRTQQTQSEEVSESLHLHSNDQVCTPLETQENTQIRRTAPLMQSTPLSVPLPCVAQIGMSEQEDDFIADIISQINTPQIRQTTQNRSVRQEPSALSEATFLREFNNIFKQRSERKQRQAACTPRTSLGQERPDEVSLRIPTPKMKMISWDCICSMKKPSPDDLLTKIAEQSFLYFSVKPGKIKNMVKRVTNNLAITEGESGHISIRRRMNLSNVIRAHVSQRQSSIEQPGQASFASILRSPCTPQTLLRTSQYEPFTPIRGDVLTHSPRTELEFMSSIPARPLLRQQPLLPIPERDSTIPIPLSPQPEDVELNHISGGIAGSTDDVFTLPFEIGVNQSTTNLPNAVPEDVEMVQEQPSILQEIISNAYTVVPMQVEFNPQSDVHQTIQLSQNDIAVPQNDIAGYSGVSQPINLQNDVVVPSNFVLGDDEAQLNRQEADNNFSWFEVLRPRGEIVYPKVGSVRRKKKTSKRKIESEDVQHPQISVLPEIPLSPQISALPEIPLSPEHHNTHSVPDEILGEVTQIQTSNFTEENEPEFNGYFALIKLAGKNHKYKTWEHFDPYLFSESRDLEIITNIFKRIMKDDFVFMDTLFKDVRSRLEAAKGFKLILELKTMGLIEIEAIHTRIVGFKFNAVHNLN